MKNFYNPNPRQLRKQIATVAFRSISGRIQRQTTLLLLSLLLLNVNGFGQTYTSVRSGPWHEPATWGKTAAGDYPRSTNDVYISNGHAVTILSGAYNCRDLRIYAGSGNPKTGGQIIIGDTTNLVTSEAKLILSNVMFETTQGRPKERATLRMARNGYLTVSAAITKGKFQGNNNADYTNNADIFYRFSSTSTIEYSGADQNIFNFYELPATNTSEVATTYGNITLSGTGTKTPVAGLGVRGNLKVNSGSTFAASTLTHTIVGNLENTGTINAASSTINIGGNFTNSINGATGTFISGTGTVNYNGGAQTVANLQYYNLTFSNSGTNEVEKTAGGDIKVLNALSVANNSIVFIPSTYSVEYNGNNQNIAPLEYNNLILSGGTVAAPVVKTALGTISVASGFTIQPYASFAHNMQTFFYNGRSQNITPATYYHLTLAGANTKSATASLSVQGDLQVYSGVTFGASGNHIHSIAGNVTNDGIINVATATTGNQLNVKGSLINKGTFNAMGLTHTITGNWQNTFTFNAGTSSIVLDGLNKAISSTGTGAFNNLTVSNGTSSMTTDITVKGALRVENTVLQTGTSTLFLDANANLMTLETATSHIKGTMQATRSLSTAQGQTFGNIGVRITNSPSAISAVTVRRVTGTPFISNSQESVLRQFHITTSDASSTGLGSAALEMRFPDYELNGGTGTTAYDIYRQDLNGLLEKLAGSAATAPQEYNYKLDAAQKFGMYTLSSNIAPLPVELVWFKAARQAKGVQLTWETASEVDNSGFEVQVSVDGKNFKKVDFVQSRAGNSSIAQRYIYLDTKTASFGTRYYRLAQIDFDGITTFSSIKAVTIDGSPVTVAAYPNPFSEGQQVKVNLPAGESRRVSLVMTNALGQVIHNEQVQVQEGQHELLVNTAKAETNGMYLLNVIDNGTKHSFKLMKR